MTGAAPCAAWGRKTSTRSSSRRENRTDGNGFPGARRPLGRGEGPRPGGFRYRHPDGIRDHLQRLPGPGHRQDGPDRLREAPVRGGAVPERLPLPAAGKAGLRGEHTPRSRHGPTPTLPFRAGDRILFPCDSLGAHYASPEFFNDELPEPSSARKAFEFYYNTIMRPYKEHVLKACGKIKDLPIAMIAPSHGPILRKVPRSYIAC